jgi:hypothetical protein
VLKVERIVGFLAIGGGVANVNEGVARGCVAMCERRGQRVNRGDQPRGSPAGIVRESQPLTGRMVRTTMEGMDAVSDPGADKRVRVACFRGPLREFVGL